MNCPACGQEAADSTPTCACGEQLTPWRTMQASGAVLRRRGQALAAGGDFLGALLCFLEAALTTPLDGSALVDAAKALYHLNRPEEALRWLEYAQKLVHGDRAAAVAGAVRAMQARPVESPPEASPVPQAPEAAPAAVALLRLGPLPRARRFSLGKKRDVWWDVVLRMEQKAVDWRPRAEALEALLKQAAPPALWSYVCGLGCWQRGETADARTWFEKSIQEKAPDLNPVIYYLLLVLDDPARARRDWGRLRGPYQPQELQTCCERLAAVLAAAGEDRRLGALRDLQAGRTAP